MSIEFLLLILLAPAAWLLIFRRWRLGLYFLLAYLPFTGIPVLLFYPSTLPVLFKDFLFVIPLYLAFFLGASGVRAGRYVPASVRMSVVALVVLILVQTLNPNLSNWLVAAIGLKVWLMYIPLTLVAIIFFRDSMEQDRLLRMMVVMAWIPCIVGIAQWIGMLNLGYRETMELMYGELGAEAATQQFVQFDLSVGQYFRVTSTFSYPVQYLGFILGMLTVCHIVVNSDPSRGWRKLAWATWALLILAGFLCGARAAYLFVPLLLGLTFALSGRLKAGLGVAALVPAIGLLGAAIGQFELKDMVELVFGLTSEYGEDIAFTFIKNALSDTVLGMGTGANTGAARYAFENPDLFVAYENYYAKLAYELGLLGLILYVTFELSVLWQGVKLLRSSRGRQVDVVAGLLAFFVTMFLNNFKGWQMDLDPINVYFWLFLGLLWSLRARKQVAGSAARDALPERSRAVTAEQVPAFEMRPSPGER